MGYQSAGQIHPEFPGKGAAPGWYNVNGKSRYYVGGNEFRNSGDGAYNLSAMVGSVFQPKPLSPERQARSDAQRRFNEGDRTALDQYYPNNSTRYGSKPGAANASETTNSNTLPLTPAGNTYEVSGVTYDRSSGRALNPDTGKPSENGYSINSSTGNRTDGISTPPLSSPTRDVPKPDGSRGTSTSPGGGSSPIMGMQDVDDLYERLGLGSYSDYKPGYSRPKPQQQTSGIGPVVSGGEYGQMLEATNGTRGVGPVNSGQAYATNLSAVNRNPGNRNTSTFTSISPNDPQFAEVFGQDLADQRIREANGGITSDRLREALDDTESMRGESSVTAGDRGRYAFLDAEDSLVGLRARDRELGVVRAGGRYYGNTDDGFKEVSDKSVKDYSANRISGTDFKALFMNQEPVATPAEAQSADSINPVGVSSRPPEWSTNMGPVLDGELYGQQLETQQRMRGVGPLIDGNVYAEMLEGREPMMRVKR